MVASKHGSHRLRASMNDLISKLLRRTSNRPSGAV
jgi:hypothetical protein